MLKNQNSEHTEAYNKYMNCIYMKSHPQNPSVIRILQNSLMSSMVKF